MNDVYEVCPVLESENYLLRLIEQEDAKDLFKVYSDKKAVPFFNSDNCNGDFYMEHLEDVEDAINYWLWEYERKGFVRWSIVDQKTKEVIGTIELFHRESEDAFGDVGLLRLDLRSDYERKEEIIKILSLLMTQAYALFDCNRMATKAIASAVERRKALGKLGFTLSQESLVGHDGTSYKDYWECMKK